jgi:hypothetical protein
MRVQAIGARMEAPPAPLTATVEKGMRTMCLLLALHVLLSIVLLIRLLFVL